MHNIHTLLTYLHPSNLKMKIFIFQEDSITKLCQSVPDNVAKQGLADSAVHNYAKDISQKFSKLFHLYANCHNIIGLAEGIGEDDIDELGKQLTF